MIQTRLFSKFFVLTIVSSFTGLAAHASVDLERFKLEGAHEKANVWPFAPLSDSLSPDEAYRRRNLVLQEFNVPAEIDSPDISDLSSTQTQSGAQALLPWIDPNQQVKRFFDLSTHMNGYLDRDAHSIEDFSLPLAQSPDAQKVVTSLESKLEQAARTNPKGQLLRGLKIALDPGHMGGTTWDNLTGKYVHDQDGNRVSEGVINLQTALLVEQALIAQGAEVMITHRTLGAVTSLPLADLSLQDFGRKELLARSLEDWFQSLLLNGSTGPELGAAFKKDSHVKAIFAERARDNYFILDADIDARVAAIEKFNPDITLIIHYDTDDPVNNPNGLNPKGVDKTKAYVYGGVEAVEFATRESRRYMTRHFLDPMAWNASARLSHLVSHQISNELGLTLETESGENVSTVEPGVIARNLNLSRKLSSHAVTYVECLYYNAPKEFQAMRVTPHPMEIGGESHPYSDRVAQVAGAIGRAVIGFVASYQ